MNTITQLLSLLLLTVVLVARAKTDSSVISAERVFPNLPEPVSNNAVAHVTTKQGDFLISFMGLGEGKDHKAVHNKVWALKLGDKAWQVRQPVPSSLPLKGRLASVAATVKEQVYIFGGYTVAADHQEISTPDVYRYDVLTDSYTLMAPMPVPVDDSVALVYQQRYIYLISGWHNAGNVNLVQVYDVETNSWQQASPFLGIPVFGHAAAIANQYIVVCDGVSVVPQLLKRRTYQEVAQCLKGQIDVQNPRVIDWQKIEHPTNDARYRMAAAGDDNRIIMLAGSTNPYNYNGVGYDGKPAPATNTIWEYDLALNQWHTKQTSVPKSMDHRGLIMLNNSYITIGGMDENQTLLNRVLVRISPEG